MDENFSIEEVFNSAVNIVKNLPKEGSVKPSDELKLKLYAYYKQATHGPNNTPKPRFYQIVEAYKWDAWQKLGDLPKEDAMLSYINELKNIMDSIPDSSSDPIDGKHMEDVLGKKFYDYWSKQWKKSSNKEQLIHENLVEKRKSSSSQKQAGNLLINNDNISNSSRGSSMSMLDETQSLGDGYKTPNSLAFKGSSFVGEVNDQFAAAILRLQHGLEETSSRMTRIEKQMDQVMNVVQNLENQTHSKQPQYDYKSNSRSRMLSSRGSGFLGMMRTIKSIHWFYLSYPFLVFFIIRLMERRKRSHSR